MYEKILVPVDGSRTAAQGLKEAIQLARQLRSGIRIVHVLDEMPAVPPAIYGAMYDLMLEAWRKTGTSVLKAAQALTDGAGLTVDLQLLETLGGEPGEHIVRAARDWPADLIVCGTHGRRGLRRIVMGSDAEYILRHSPVPVLLVRADTHPHSTADEVDSPSV